MTHVVDRRTIGAIPTVLLILLSLGSVSENKAEVGPVRAVAYPSTAFGSSHAQLVQPEAQAPNVANMGRSDWPVADTAAISASGSLRRSLLSASRMKIVCLAKSKTKMTFGSYHMRCNQIQIAFQEWLPQVTFELATYETFERDPKFRHQLWDIAVCIKFVPSAHPPNVREVFVDVIDADTKQVPEVPEYYHAILQNVIQQAQDERFQAHPLVHIIEHTYMLLNETSIPGIRSIDPAAHQILKVVSVSCECSRADAPCMEVRSLQVKYDCIRSKHTYPSAWFSQYYPLDKNAARAIETTSWGMAYLYNLLYQEYDVVVVYTKLGWKGEYGSHQRMLNAMKSGTPTLVQRTGMHALYIGDAYPCQFTDEESFEGVLEALAADRGLRAQCQRMGLHLAEMYSPREILGKYAQAFESALASSASTPAAASDVHARPPSRRGPRRQWRPMSSMIRKAQIEE